MYFLFTTSCCVFNFFHFTFFFVTHFVYFMCLYERNNHHHHHPTWGNNNLPLFYLLLLFPYIILFSRSNVTFIHSFPSMPIYFLSVFFPIHWTIFAMDEYVMLCARCCSVRPKRETNSNISCHLPCTTYLLLLLLLLLLLYINMNHNINIRVNVSVLSEVLFLFDGKLLGYIIVFIFLRFSPFELKTRQTKY